ncbi:MAG: CHAT domain-containing protein [Proteobacteria bacterium]|nr:CHAT domain-containing protein [Pseudomonadota bacterium]
MSTIRVLFLAANPRDTARLALDREYRAIEARIRASEYRDAIEVFGKWAVQPGDLQDALLHHQPHIVHFSGHGQENSILLMDRDGSARAVPGPVLARMLGTLRDNIRVVVFSACVSAQQAGAVTEYVDFAIAMREGMDNDAAIAFYMGLGYGRSVQNAFDLGVNEIALQGVPGQDRQGPVLLARPGVDPGAVVLVGQRAFRKAAPASPVDPVPGPSRARLESRLADLLTDMFAPGDLYRFLRHKVSRELVDALPSAAHAARAQYAFLAAEKLMDRGLVTAQFADALTRERPDRADEIRALVHP